MLKFNIVITGVNIDEALTALEEARRLIGEGYLNGMNGNGESSYTFESEGWEGPAEEEA